MLRYYHLEDSTHFSPPHPTPIQSGTHVVYEQAEDVVCMNPHHTIPKMSQASEHSTVTVEDHAGPKEDPGTSTTCSRRSDNNNTTNSNTTNNNNNDQNGWYTIFLDVERSKFFDPQYAVVEGDIWKDVYVETHHKANDLHHNNDDGPRDTSSSCGSSKRRRKMALILKRQERCFVVVRRESTSVLFDTLVHSAMAQERRAIKPRTTGWLRHELYGLQAGIRLPLGTAINDGGGDDGAVLTANKRGIKCLDLPGQFIGLFDQETLQSWEEEKKKKNDGMDSGDSSLTRIIICPTPHYSADNDDVLTIQQSELQQRLTRHKHFARWLMDTFGMELLNQGTVLDVAGGNGKLSAALLKMGIHSCTIVDPQPLYPERPQEGLTIITKPLIGDGCDLTDDGPYAEKIQRCSIVVGLHPDQATEAVMDLAMRLGKPFALLPCCVMTRLFPNRKGRLGEPVRTVHQLCRYLMDKQAQIKVDYLPFMGRNKVLYWKGPRNDSPFMCQPVGVFPATSIARSNETTDTVNDATNEEKKE
jgi:hypothetical protein